VDVDVDGVGKRRDEDEGAMLGWRFLLLGEFVGEYRTWMLKE